MQIGINNKFSRDLAWNIGGFGFSAIIGILLNVVIINVYDASALGVFNQSYAIYIILSQLAVGGIHMAVQKMIPEHVTVTGVQFDILINALMLVIIVSGGVAAVSCFFYEIPGIVLESKGVSEGFKYVIPGLIFFAVNKVLMSYLNGLRHMKAFAVFQSSRFFLLLGALITLIVLDVHSDYLASILSIAEATLFVIILSYLVISGLISFRKIDLLWIRQIWDYGKKAFIGNFLLDLNTRVDIFFLGLFLSDRNVGFYSFAALVAEGFFQLPMLLRNNMNPIITRLKFHKEKDLLQRIVRMNIRKFYKLISPLGVLSVLVFPLLLWVSLIQEGFYVMWGVYAILAFGVSLAAGYLPFMMIFNQTGHPLRQTGIIFSVFIINVIGNIVLIQLFGVYGAAIGTTISNISLMLILKYQCQHILKISI